MAAPRTTDGSMYNNVYSKAEDPKEFGLVQGKKWPNKIFSVKLLWVRLALPLVGSMLETRAVVSAYDLYHRLHRRSYCWKFEDGKVPGWGKMQAGDIRALETKVYKIRAKL